MASTFACHAIRRAEEVTILRKIVTTLLIMLATLMPLCAQAAAEQGASVETRVFTDDLGREVTVPVEITRVAPTGQMAQVIMLTYDPGLLVGLSTAMAEEDMPLYPGLDADLPVLGTFYGRRADLNREALIMAAPEVVIDIGEIKGSIDEMISDLDRLQEQVGIPIVFIESYLADTANTYTRLGELLGDTGRASALSSYAEESLAFAAKVKEELGGAVSFYYSSSLDGLEAVPEGNMHGEVLEAVGGVNAVPSNFSTDSGTVSMEQLLLWNPDVIVLSNADAYADVTAPGSVWEGLDAVRNGRVYMVPDIINNWIDSPPSVNRLMGIWWAADVFYGDEAGVDINAEAERFYSLFYDYTLTDADRAQFS